MMINTEYDVISENLGAALRQAEIEQIDESSRELAICIEKIQEAIYWRSEHVEHTEGLDDE